MGGWTRFAATSIRVTREVLFPPPCPAAAPRAPWFESVPKRRPPAAPPSKASPMAGPSTWKLALVGEVGLPTAGVAAQRPSKSGRPRRQRPFLSKTVRSGVNGFVALKHPPPPAG